MDPLAEVFSSSRIGKAIFTRLYATAPWGFISRRGAPVKFALVLRGGGILQTEAHPVPVQLSQGDIFIMLDDAPYSIVDDPASALLDCDFVETLRVGNVIRLGGGGETTAFISGQFEIDRLSAKPILNVLPKFLHLKADAGRTQAFQSVLELLATETEQPGLASESMVARLYEMLFIHAVRSYTSGCEIGHGGWLAGITDPQLGETIRTMHGNLQRDWTVEILAQHAGMSRSAFAAKFKAVIGQTPLDYLTRWRVYRAGMLIRRNTSTISEVSYAVGYESESAFTKVFRRHTGVTPSQFRKRHVAGEGAPASGGMSLEVA